MTRKLHNTLLALSTTGLVLVAGLMAGTPLPSAAPLADAYADHAGNTTVRPAVATASIRAEARAAAAIEASALRYEAEMLKVEDPGEAIAMTATFIAGVVTDAALAAAMEGIESAASTDAEPAQPERKSQRKRRTSRSAFATPYFSFARGLRQGNGA